MIKKIKYLKNLAVFKNFNWDLEVFTKNGDIGEFKKTNIIYGRNYSGKTTLSRTFRFIETGIISDKYDSPEFCFELENNSEINEKDSTSSNQIVRVFNHDFITENLKFISNSSEEIETFAVLGEDNNKVEEELKTLNDKLGSDEHNKETGLYSELKVLQVKARSSQMRVDMAENKLREYLSNKATGDVGIKYNSETYGDINYNITKLKRDIETVKKDDFIPLTKDQKNKAESLITERSKPIIPEFSIPNYDLDYLSIKTKELVIKEISRSNKINELLKSAILNRWVKEGRDIHLNDNLNICAFCNNHISEDRWKSLETHFDEESNNFEKELGILKNQIEKGINLFSEVKAPNKEDYYTNFHSNYELLSIALTNFLKEYIQSLENLRNQIDNRVNNLLNPQEFIDVPNIKEEFDRLILEFNKLRLESNEYSNKLSNEQKSAKDNLRLFEVHKFINTIKFDDQETQIINLKITLGKDKLLANNKRNEINEIIDLINEKKKELIDETKGAERVNELLGNHFGHSFLSLKAIRINEELSSEVSYRFEVQRENKRAYHLSEGENSLIAFCYFMAKLGDVNTAGTKPIIWIDDPISSLDSNHIFFVYSLINALIFGQDDFHQLFISTHNLNFLKYLKRLPGAKASSKTAYFLIERNDKLSTLKSMPNYLKEYVSEFNYLFEQIYKCSLIENLNDENYTMFYSFGNNARKFLELFLYYKYPDFTSQNDKMIKFFGDDAIPAVLTDRINNEYSHLRGTFERGESIVEIPEMTKVAKLIIERIKLQDIDQHKALLNSIGVELEQ